MSTTNRARVSFAMKAAPRFKTQIEEKQDKEDKEAIEESKKP